MCVVLPVLNIQDRQWCSSLVNGAGGFCIYMIIFVDVKYTVIPNRFGQMRFNANRATAMFSTKSSDF